MDLTAGRRTLPAVLRWTGLGEVPAGFGPSVVTVGVFDGVHHGHARLVRRAVADAESLGATPVVVTFDPNPLVVLRPDLAPAELASLERRLELFAGLGARATLVLPFTRDLASESPEQFVDRVLVGALRARAVVVGENFRFGHRAAGDVALLRGMGAERGFEVDGLALAGEGGVTWSSTWIRQRIAAGEVEAAAGALGRPHRVEGVVVPGDRRGAAIGYPTANLATVPRAAVPADGVYAGWLVTGRERLPAAISVGTNPTFDGVGRRVEAYALDRDDLRLYGRPAAVEFAARLRDMLRFDTVETLVAQMDRDVERTRALVSARVD